jgi:hypothetical protein
MTKYIIAILLLTASCTTTEHISSKENYLRKAIIDHANDEVTIVTSFTISLDKYNEIKNKRP